MILFPRFATNHVRRVKAVKTSEATERFSWGYEKINTSLPLNSRSFKYFQIILEGELPPSPCEIIFIGLVPPYHFEEKP